MVGLSPRRFFGGRNRSKSPEMSGSPNLSGSPNNLSGSPNLSSSPSHNYNPSHSHSHSHADVNATADADADAAASFELVSVQKSVGADVHKRKRSSPPLMFRRSLLNFSDSVSEENDGGTATPLDQDQDQGGAGISPAALAAAAAAGGIPALIEGIDHPQGQGQGQGGCHNSSRANTPMSFVSESSQSTYDPPALNNNYYIGGTMAGPNANASAGPKRNLPNPTHLPPRPSTPSSATTQNTSSNTTPTQHNEYPEPPTRGLNKITDKLANVRYKLNRSKNNKYARRKKRLQKKNGIGSPQNGAADEKLNTYEGVFLPCIAQIVGVIFFLRLPTITGQAGVVGTSLIILTCVFSTFVTSLSLSAIASNGTIQAGGPYYIISRTLGIEIGGALGLLFYLGTTLGASMHVMGAVETLTHREKHAYHYPKYGLVETCPSQIWSLLLMFLIAKVVSVGSKYVTKAANFFLVTVALSIFSILVGTILFAFQLYDGSLQEGERTFNDNLYPNYRPDPKTGDTPTFWSLVAIFYPATTGIMAGTNRSSVLATPNTSIPIGTISAIAVTTTLYIFQVWLLGSVANHETLIFNKLVLASVAFPSAALAKIGMVTSCIGAALQCMAGAPQLLGAIAADGAIPFLKFLSRKKKRRRVYRRRGDNEKTMPPVLPVVCLANGDSIVSGLETLGQSTSNDAGNGANAALADDSSVDSERSEDVATENSNRAIWFSWAIASMGTLLGNIDHITPILTMFYLMMYGGINLCCFLLAWVDSPGFRPQFRFFSRKTALMGFLWCLVLAMLISWVMALVAMVLLCILYTYIYLSAQKKPSPNLGGSFRTDGRRNPILSGTNWGDVFDSVRYKITTMILKRVTGSENFHAKNWRPQLLTFVDMDNEGNPQPSASGVLALAAQFKGGRGLNMVVSVKRGSYLKTGAFEFSQHCHRKLKQNMEGEGLQGFSEVVMTSTTYSEAAWSAVVHSGLGPVSPNTVLLGWMTDWRNRIEAIDAPPPPSLDHCQNLDEMSNVCSASDFVVTIKGLANMKRAVCVFKGKQFPRRGDVVPPGSTIDIYWAVDDGGLCLLLSYIISRNPIWKLNGRLRVFAVTTTAGENPQELETAVVLFLQQIRINATVQVVILQDTVLANDFRGNMGDGAPDSAPTHTIGEKFQKNKDDASESSSVVGGGMLLDSTGAVCGPNLNLIAAGTDDAPGDREQYSKVETLDHREYVAMVENQPDQLFLMRETAEKFNQLIRTHSQFANLVVTHLPLAHKITHAKDFMEYVDAIFNDVDNMLLIRGTGVEYLTTVA